MIPDLPKGITRKDSLDFYSKIAGNLSDQSTHHINWHTHRKNPSVCWICDLNLLNSRLLAVQGLKYAKSTIDRQIMLNQETESKTESEEEFHNYDEEVGNAPEYDVVDEPEE